MNLTIGPRRDGDDVVLQLRMRRANLPVFTDGFDAGVVALRAEGDGTYCLAVQNHAHLREHASGER